MKPELREKILKAKMKKAKETQKSIITATQVPKPVVVVSTEPKVKDYSKITLLTNVLPKILVVKKGEHEKGWNKHLPAPLGDRERVILLEQRANGNVNYVRVRHKGKNVSVFALRNFTDLKGRKLKLRGVSDPVCERHLFIIEQLKKKKGSLASKIGLDRK